MNFKRTIDNPQWLAKNTDAIRSIFPHRWVCMCTISTNARLLSDSFRQLGVNVRNAKDAADAVCILINRDILEFVQSAQCDIHKHGYFRVKPHGMDADVELVITA